MTWHPEKRQMRDTDGFTLIELLIVMAIIAIMAALTYPSYQDYVIKARRIEGQAALLETMQNQERYYSAHNTYIAFSSASTDPDEKRFKWYSGERPDESAYELSAHACDGASLRACIEVRATPGTPKVDVKFRDPGCKTLALTSTGMHSATGQGGRCWP